LGRPYTWAGELRKTPRGYRFCAPPPPTRPGKRCLPTDMRAFNCPTVPSCCGDLFAWKETRRRDKGGLGQPRPSLTGSTLSPPPSLRLTATQLALPASPPLLAPRPVSLRRRWPDRSFVLPRGFLRHDVRLDLDAAVRIRASARAARCHLQGTYHLYTVLFLCD
jgi:hypothetical protein